MSEQEIWHGGVALSAFWFVFMSALVCNHYLQPRAFAFLVWCILSAAGFWLFNFLFYLR